MSSESTRTPPVGEGDLGDVLSGAERPRRAGTVSASLTLGWRAMLTIKHVPFQLFDVTAFPLMFTLLGDLVRYGIAAVMVIGLGVVPDFRPGAGVVGVPAGLALVLVIAFALSWIWILVGLSVEKPESVMATSSLLLFPLTFVSNIFVDPATMPGYLQTVVGVNPVTHLTDATRGLVHGGVELGDEAWALVASALVVAVFAPPSLRKYRQER